jgi:predicted membrane protein
VDDIHFGVEFHLYLEVEGVFVVVVVACLLEMERKMMPVALVVEVAFVEIVDVVDFVDLEGSEDLLVVRGDRDMVVEEQIINLLD